MLFWFRYYNCNMREAKTDEEAAWLEMEIWCILICMCVPTAVGSEMERGSYAMVKKDSMSIKSFYTTLQKKAVCSFGQVFDVCFSILVSKY